MIDSSECSFLTDSFHAADNPVLEPPGTAEPECKHKGEGQVRIEDTHPSEFEAGPQLIVGAAFKFIGIGDCNWLILGRRPLEVLDCIFIMQKTAALHCDCPHFVDKPSGL